jgi:pilus assembly protein CpaF
MGHTLRLLDANSSLELACFRADEKHDYAIGRSDGCDCVLHDPTVSRNHARITFRDGYWWVTDDGSRFGTFTDRRVTGTDLLLPHQTLTFGTVVCLLEIEKPEEAGSGTGQGISAEEQAREFLYQELLQRISLRKLQQEALSDDELEKRVRAVLKGIVDENGDLISGLSDSQVQQASREVIEDVLKLGPLEPILADDDVTEIMVVGFDRIYVEKKGKITLTSRVFRDPAHLVTTIQRIVTPLGRRIDETSPLVDARLKDGSRVNAVIPPISPDGACLTIRKFGKLAFDVQMLVQFGSLTPEMGEFLRVCVTGKKNIVVSGGTGSGKTSLLNALSRFIGESERIVTIEDALELKLQQEHVVRMEARPKNAEGRGEVSIRHLVKNSLRMRPDRIVVGECRGGEALDMLQAMNTGHDGSLTTVHANNPRDAISRLETLVLMAGMDLPLAAVLNQIISAVDIIVQTTRLTDGSRKVVNICEVCGQEAGVPVLNEVFVFKQEGIDREAGNKVLGRHQAISVPTFAEDFRARGLPLDMSWFRRDP